MQLKQLTNYLESIAPLHYQMGYDNSGLLTGHSDQQITGVLIALDCIESVVEEAIEKHCNVIVAHHPILFSGKKRLTGADYVERTLIKAIKNDIAIYAIHTNLDAVLVNGVNTEIAHRLMLSDLKILSPDLKLNADRTIGAGILGKLPDPMPSIDFLNFLKSCMDLKVIKHTKIVFEKVHKIAVCGGSGHFLLEAAKSINADVLITSDIKYHQFFDAEEDILLIDIGHYESERFTIELLYRLITEKFSTFAALKTEVNTNPVFYF